MESELYIKLLKLWNEADELCASFETPECLDDPDSLKAMERRAIYIRNGLHNLTG